MSDAISEIVNTTDTNDETQSLNGQELGYANCANSSLGTPGTSEEVARQIKVGTDTLF